MNYSSIKNYKRLIASIGMATLLTVAVAAPALADEVTVSVTGGSLTASIADTSLSGVTYSHTDDQDATGTLDLTVDDSRGTGAGWNVTVQSSNFIDGDNSISNEGFAVDVANTPTVNDGQAIDVTGGPRAGSTGALDTPLMVIDAAADSGQGNYSQDLDVVLNVPALTQAGSYTATLTVSATSGPAS